MTHLVGLLGYPLSHSISPVFQQAAFDHYSLPVHYHAWPTPPEELHQTLLRLLSVAPLTTETWERYEPAFDSVMTHLSQTGHHHSDDSIDIV